jgi:hypothetical protein
MKTMMLIFLIAITVKAHTQTTRCDQYGYSYCYLKYSTDQNGNIIYDGIGQPRLTEFSTNDPVSEPHLRFAPNIPLKICFTNAMTIDNLWQKKHAWCEGSSYTDKDEFAVFFRATLNAALHEVQQQLDVCGYDGSQTKLLVQTDCEDLSDQELMNSGVILWFKQTGMSSDVTADAVGGWMSQDGNPQIRQLRINIADQFIIGKSRVLPKTEWCFSGQCTNCKYLSVNDAHCLDLRRILIHEIGHFLGLAHSNACMTEAQYPGSSTEYKKEVMYDKYTCSNFNDFTMSCYMQCALQKIYCPDQANLTSPGYRLAMFSGSACPVINRIETYYSDGLSFSLFPSVTDNRITFFLNHFTGPVEIRIVAPNGNVVIEETKYVYRSYLGDYYLDNVSSGHYFFIVSDGVRVGVAPVIVRK